MERFVLHIVEFYGAVDPTSMTPTLKQRVYSMKDGQYFGHLCSHCGSLGAGLRCVLLFSCVCSLPYPKMIRCARAGVRAATASIIAPRTASGTTGRLTSVSAILRTKNRKRAPRVLARCSWAETLRRRRREHKGRRAMALYAPQPRDALRSVSIRSSPASPPF